MCKSMKYFAAVFSILVLSLSALGQGKVENEKDSLAIMNWLSKSFVFNKPDTGFVALPEGNGYANTYIGATIKYITFPGEYAKVKTEFVNQKSTATSLVKDILYHKLNNQEALSVIIEEVSPDKAQYENFISIITVVGFGDVTACIVGAYPKSKDVLLREKYIKASLTLKEQ
jgi:hypothetical protein